MLSVQRVLPRLHRTALKGSATAGRVAQRGVGLRTLLLVAFLPLAAVMITPLFRLEQDDKHVIVIARTPYVKAHEAEMDVTRSGFKMHVKPYFLSLSFKQPLREGEPEKASWCALRLPGSRLIWEGGLNPEPGGG